MTATVITSIPFLAFIYAALRYLIFGSKSVKQSVAKNKWPLSQIVLAFICLFIVYPFFSIFISTMYFSIAETESQRKSGRACIRMEADAQYATATVASYYADPDNTTIPTVEQLIEEEDLSTNYPVRIEEDANRDPVITIYDEKAECYKGDKLVIFFHSGQKEWQN